MELEKTLLRKVGEAIHRFKMIRDGDRVAVALSGGKDSVTLLEALLLLADRAPIDFTVCAFTVEQGKFLRPIEPLGEYLKQRGVDWTYYRDKPSLRLLEEQPGHGCDLCSRYRRRAVYEICSGLGANVIAFGHTADDFCEALLRNTLFTGRLSALPPVTHSRDRQFRLIRPLVFVTEDITRAYAGELRCARNPLRLFPAHRHGAALVARAVRRTGKRASASEGEHPFRHGQRGYKEVAGPPPVGSRRPGALSDPERILKDAGPDSYQYSPGLELPCAGFTRGIM